MHFSIPDTTEVKEGGGTYHNFNLHVNGVYFCSLRYSQLHDFSLQLKKEPFDQTGIDPFPPKKQTLLPLTPFEIDERREALEKYLQSICQHPEASRCDLFNAFFLTAQQDAYLVENTPVEVDVFLANGRKVTVEVMALDRTDDVLEKVAKRMELPEQFTYYFGLFVTLVEPDDTHLLMRKLQNFESPHVSLRAARQIAEASEVSGEYRLTIRKWYWDSHYDDELLEDKVGTNLLYVQTVADLENGWIMAPKATLRQLQQLQSKGSRKEYVQQARTLHHYGHLQFAPVRSNFPKSITRAVVSIGPKELAMQISTEEGQTKEVAFKVTRMRCWKITALIEESSAVMSRDNKLELAFDYLFTKDKLQWVRLVGPQAIFMSSCLGSIVAELIDRKENRKIRTPADRHVKPKEAYTFKRNTAAAGVAYTEHCQMVAQARRSSANSSKSSTPRGSQSNLQSGEPSSPGADGSPTLRDDVFSEGRASHSGPSGRSSSTPRASSTSYTQATGPTMKDRALASGRRLKNFVVQNLASTSSGAMSVDIPDEEESSNVFNTIDDDDL